MIVEPIICYNNFAFILYTFIPGFLRFSLALVIMLCFLGIVGKIHASHISSVGSYEEAKLLREKLFITNGYDRKVRPSRNYTDPMDIYISLHLRSINGLDESAEILTTTGYIMLSWYDSELVWNTTDFGNISFIYIPQNDVWKPDIALANSVKQFSDLGIEMLNVAVYYDGLVYWYPFEMFVSSCAIDITHFPFDEQTCKFKFVAWSYSKSDINMTMYSFGGGIDFSTFEPNSQWEIIGSGDATEEDAEESSVVFSLKLKRKPRFMLMAVILPTIMLSMLSVLTFLLPCDSGEKASYAVTVFLSFSIFLTIISSTLPQNSDTTSLFTIYLVIQVAQSTIITIIAMILIRVGLFKPEIRIPNALVWIVRRIYCHPIATKGTKISPAKPKLEDIEADTGFETMDKKANTNVLASNVDTFDTDWKEVVNALDICCLIFFSLFTVISTTVCLGIAAS